MLDRRIGRSAARAAQRPPGRFSRVSTRCTRPKSARCRPIIASSTSSSSGCKLLMVSSRVENLCRRRKPAGQSRISRRCAVLFAPTTEERGLHGTVACAHRSFLNAGRHASVVCMLHGSPVSNLFLTGVSTAASEPFKGLFLNRPDAIWSP